jgi:hypothetical protein
MGRPTHDASILEQTQTHTHTHRHTYRIIYDCAPFINYGYTKVRFTNQCDYNIQPYNGTGMFCTSTQYTRGTLAHAHAYTQSYTRPCACMWHAQSRTSTNLCRVATRRTRTLTSGHASEVQSTCHTGPPITPRADGYKASRPKCRAPCPAPRPPHSSRNGTPLQVPGADEVAKREVGIERLVSQRKTRVRRGVAVAEPVCDGRDSLPPSFFHC